MRALRKYLITLLIGFACVGLILWSKDIFGQDTPVKIYHILCDAFFAVGTVIVCAGLLVFSANEGTFDMLAYGMRSFMDMFRKNKLNKYDTFFDYRMSKADKKVRFGFLLICGAFFLAVSMVMYYLYSLHK